MLTTVFDPPVDDSYEGAAELFKDGKHVASILHTTDGRFLILESRENSCMVIDEFSDLHLALAVAKTIYA